MDFAERPSPTTPSTHPSATRAALPGAVAMVVLAAIWLWRGRPVAALLSLLAVVATVQLAVVLPESARRLASLLERIGHGLGVVFGVGLLGAIWLVVILPVALVNRVVGIDLLDRDGVHGWRPTPVALPQHRYQRESPPRVRPGRRLLRVAVVLVPLVAVSLAVVDKATTVPRQPQTPFGDRSTGDVADDFDGVVYDDVWFTYRGVPMSRRLFPGEPWAADLLAVQEEPAPCDAVDATRAELPEFDLATEYVNVVDGRRRTLDVPRPEHTVWLFGGSTTYGIGQRDDHTIASELVRLARADGLQLDVVNLGCPGKVNWVETEHFELLLERGTPPPDAAVFLDGINEWTTAFQREVYGRLDLDEPFRGFPSQDVQDALGAEARARGYEETHDPERQMRLAAGQYGAGVERARLLGAERDIPLVHFWQPALATMPVTAPGNLTVFHSDDVDPSSGDQFGPLYQQAAELSAVDPIDLTDIFDEASQPLFFDCCHTNEAGARLEAAAMYPYVRAALLDADAPLG